MAGSSWATPLRQIRDLFHQGTPAGSSDAQLLAKFAASGDPRAFEALVGRHGPMVAATCRAVLRNEHDAEDAFQATFLVLARKARSVRAGETLGPWLHRVAYRAAVQAGAQARRRQQEESEAGFMAIQVRAGSGEADEARRLVHEEVDRLPDRHRLPVVLCDLEGLSYAEAASRLGLTEPALRTRLARGRERLRERLQGRGVSAGVVAATLSRPLVRAVVPLAWSHAAVASATGTAAPAGAVAIAEKLMRGMLIARIKLFGGMLLGASILSTAGVVLAARPPEPPAPAPLAARPRGQEAKQAKKEDEERTEVRGIVLDPEGKPVAGAKIQSAVPGGQGEPAKATSGADGRFVIQVPNGIMDGRIAGIFSSTKWLTAFGGGFGLATNDGAGRADPRTEQIIRLVPEGEPIEGRVVDEEGRPVAGATVRASVIFRDRTTPDDLSRWLARLRSGVVREIHQELENLMGGIETTTRADGRFRLNGVGHQRVARLDIEGPGIATIQTHVMTLDEPESRTAIPYPGGAYELVVHSPRFEIAVPRGRTIEGTVFSEETGQPIAGATLSGRGNSRDPHHYFLIGPATTDAEGHYKLSGLPLGDAYELVVGPPPGSPLLAQPSYQVVATSLAGPIVHNLALARGVIVRGRVVDGDTGQPAEGWVEACSFEEDPRPNPSGAGGHRSPVMIDREGRFQVATPPGRGLLMVRSDNTRFRGASGFETIRGYDASLPGFMMISSYVDPRGTNAVVEYNAPASGESEPVEIRLDPGKTARVKVCDADGLPVDGVYVRGLSEASSYHAYPVAASEFDVHALDPSRPRRLIISRKDRELIGSVVLTGEEQGPVEVRLQPWGGLSGRVVDGLGEPLKGVQLYSNAGSTTEDPWGSDVLPGTEIAPGLYLGDDGRFQVEGLVPGLKYGARAMAGESINGELFKDRVVGPGEVVDLGDLKVVPGKDEP